MAEVPDQSSVDTHPTRAARRSQAERSTSTQNAILEATLACLVEHGYTSVIQKRAGVSRGALTHQFPSKSDLIIATARYLSDLRATRLLARLADAPSEGDRTTWLLWLLWEEGFDSALFQAAIELWTAARTVPELQATLRESEHQLARKQRENFALALGNSIAQRPSFPRAYETVVQQMRGAALLKLVRAENKTDEEFVTDCVRMFRNELNLQGI